MKQVMHNQKRITTKMVITNDRCVSKHEKKSNNFVLNKTRRRHQGKIKVYAVCPQIGHGR